MDPILPKVGASGKPGAVQAPLLTFPSKPPGKEWLIVVANIPARKALHAYRKRRAI
jgi:hypothetical protein